MTNRSTAFAVPIVVAVLALTGCASSTDGQATPVGANGTNGTLTNNAATNNSQTTASPTTPITINTSGIERLINTDSVRKWVGDVERGDIATLTAKCWTMSPSYIRDKYIAPGGARLTSILSQTPTGAQAGVWWGKMNAPSVSVTWAEGKSDYACPKVDLTGSDPISDDYLAYRVKRYILRAKGTPVNAGDTESSYGLECDLQSGSKRNVANADPENIAVTQLGEHHWQAQAGSVIFDVGYEPAEPCIVSAS